MFVHHDKIPQDVDLHEDIDTDNATCLKLSYKFAFIARLSLGQVELQSGLLIIGIQYVVQITPEVSQYPSDNLSKYELGRCNFFAKMQVEFKGQPTPVKMCRLRPCHSLDHPPMRLGDLRFHDVQGEVLLLEFKTCLIKIIFNQFSHVMVLSSVNVIRKSFSVFLNLVLGSVLYLSVEMLQLLLIISKYISGTMV